MEIKEMLFSFRDHYGSYHNHKEQMAYGATVLYLAGATAVILKGDAILSPTVPRWTAFAAFGAGFSFAVSFVAWQFHKREIASDIVTACTTLLIRLVAEPNAPLSREPDSYKGIDLPKALVDDLCRQHANRKFFLSPRVSEWLTYVAMVIWSVLALVSMLSSAPTGQ